MAKTTGQISTNRGITWWRIHDFYRLTKNVRSYILSPSFYSAGADWRLVVRTNDTLHGPIEIYLRRLTYSVAEQRVEARVSIKNCEGKNYKSKSINHIYRKNHGIWGGISLTTRWELFIMKSYLLPNDTLTVHCQMRVDPSSGDSGSSVDKSSQTDSSMESVETGTSLRQHIHTSSQTETPDACKGDGDLTRTSASVQNLQTDYKKLLESKEEADVCLKVSDKEFLAHKCILRARSSVFFAMFKHDTEENSSGEVVIEDLDGESFPLFLQHVYAGSVDNLSVENVFSLYIAADKYNVADLKSECKSYMERTLSVDTFCDVMILALRYKEDELLKIAIDFFCKNLKKIIVTVKWQIFSKEHNTEANELFIKALVPEDER